MLPPFPNHNYSLSPCQRHNCSVFFILAGYLCWIAVGIDFIAQLPQGFSIVSGNNKILRKITKISLLLQERIPIRPTQQLHLKLNPAINAPQTIATQTNLVVFIFIVIMSMSIRISIMSMTSKLFNVLISHT